MQAHSHQMAQEEPPAPSSADDGSASMKGGRRLRAQGHRRVTADGMPLVSIITVVRNAASLLEQTIASVAGQTYENAEYIVIDGCSNDGTVDILRHRESAIDYWVSEPDGGIYDAMNKGLEHCSGELIGIIGAGDWYEKDAVERAVETFLRTRCDVVYGNVEMVDADTDVSYYMTTDSGLMPKKMSSICHPSVFARRSIYLPRLFDTRFRIAADYDLFLELCKAGCHFEHCGSLVVHIRTGGVSTSLPTLGDVFLVQRKHYGLPYALHQFLKSTARYLFYASRGLTLRLLLPPTTYKAMRIWWLRRKHARSKQHVGTISRTTKP